jgi:hypothetical protein
MYKLTSARVLIWILAAAGIGMVWDEGCRAQGLKLKGDIRAEDAWNPKPESDDLELPMPCGAKMILKAVCIHPKGYLWDQETRFGCDQCERSGREYYERKYGGSISGPFDSADFPESWRRKLSKDQSGTQHCYLIGKYEVTQLQWRAIMENRCPGTSDPLTPQDAMPKTDITWYEANDFTQRYTAWLLKEAPGALPRFAGDSKNTGFIRLPTESEWEYAARGGQKASLDSHRQEELFERDKSHPITDYAVYRPEGAAKIEERPQRIGSRAPNPLGLYDTAGNVAEMALDAFRFSLGGRLHGSAGGFVRKGGGYLSGQGEIMPGRREEVAFFQLEGPTRARDLGLRVVLSGINTPGGMRPNLLEQEWKKAGEEHDFVLDQSKSPVEEIDRLLKGSKTDQERQNLTYLRNILKDNNIALERQRNTAAEGLIRSSVYAVETTLNYAIRRKGVRTAISQMEMEKKESVGKKSDYDFDKVISESKTSLKKLDEAVEASLMYYRTKIDECLNYPKEILDAQFKAVQNDYRQSNMFAQSLSNNLDLFRKHADLIRKGKTQQLSRDVLFQEIIPERLR